MLVAAIGSDVYNVFQVLHTLAVVAAFGPVLILPRLARVSAEQAATVHLRIVLPALVLTWVFGMGLAGLSDDVWELTELWIALSLVIVAALVATGVLVVRPALTGRAPQSRLAAAAGVHHLLLAVALYLMIFKPGA